MVACQSLELSVSNLALSMVTASISVKALSGSSPPVTDILGPRCSALGGDLGCSSRGSVRQQLTSGELTGSAFSALDGEND
jgi:hypothetical protein